jgi:hypothetical protein
MTKNGLWKKAWNNTEERTVLLQYGQHLFLKIKGKTAAKLKNDSAYSPTG